MVDVDDLLRIGSHEFGRKDLHVAREYDEIYGMALEHGKYLLLGGLLALSVNRNEKKGHSIKIGDGLVIGMIGDNAGDIAIEFAALMAIEQINQAVVVLRNQYGHPLAYIRNRDAPLHLKFGGDLTEMPNEITQGKVEVGGIEFDTHQKSAGIAVPMLVSVKNTAAMLVNESRNAGDHALPIGTI